MKLSGSLMPFVGLCDDCSRVAVLFRDGKWCGMPYCATHYLALVVAAMQEATGLDRLAAEVEDRCRILRALGPVPTAEATG